MSDPADVATGLPTILGLHVEDIAAVVRTTVAAPIAGALVAHGVIMASNQEQVTGALIALLIGIWSLYQKRMTRKVIRAAIAAPAGQAK